MNRLFVIVAALVAALLAPHVAQADPGYPPHKVLRVAWEMQKTSYWCGPATARMLLKIQKGGGAPSQATLAKSMTADDGGTNRYEMRNVLNRYLGSKFYSVHEGLHRPATATEQKNLKRDVVAAVHRNHGVALGIWTKPGSARPVPGYPNVDHWVAIIGYENWGERLYIADPINNSKVPEKYWVRTTDLAKYIKVYIA